MSDNDCGEEFELTHEQFEEIVKEVLESTKMLILKFGSIDDDVHQKIAEEYTDIYRSYYGILQGYQQRRRLGVELIPTVKFDHEAGVMAPGYRHKESVDRFIKWYKILKGKKRVNGNGGYV
jgi:hypothetical protein